MQISENKDVLISRFNAFMLMLGLYLLHSMLDIL